ncbi:MAG TPA: hypothetical protein ENJ00_07395 [Phycisphaerales bacterium]|nr:hypothetical protein [Phycisphaerales bacterium]
MRSHKQRVLKRLAILGTLAAVVLAVGLVLVVANTLQKQRMLTDARNTGLAAYDAGEYDIAVEKLGYVHSRQSDDPEIAYKLADASRHVPRPNREHLRSAVLLARQASSLAPTDPKPIELELELNEMLNQQTERLSAADRLLALDPNNEAALTAKAKALSALGRTDEALEVARDLAELMPDNSDAHRLVIALLASEDEAVGKTQIRDYIKELAKMHPVDPDFTILRIHAAALIGDVEHARTIADTLKDAQFDAENLTEAVRALDLLGMRSDADDLLDRYGQDPEMSKATAVLAVRRLFMRGRPSEAKQVAERALEADGTPDPELIPWALACGIDLDQATIESVISASGEESAYYKAIVDGFDALESGDAASAREIFRMALAARHNDPLAGALLADAHDRLGAWNDAARERQMVLRAAPEFTTVRLAYIESLLDRHKPVEADAVVREGLNLDPSNGALLLAHVLAVADMTSTGQAQPEEIRGAIRVCRALEDGTDGVTPATIPLARLLVASGSDIEARHTIGRLLDADPDALDVRQLLALGSLMKLYQFEGEEGIESIIDRSSNLDPYVLLERATALADAGDSEAGLALIDGRLEAAKAASDAHVTQLEMARAAYLDRIADPDAIEAIRALADRYPDTPSIQVLVLESRSAWSDRELISRAVAKLRQATGDDSTAWRIHEARRRLTFDPTEQSAASVVTLLDPIVSSPMADPMANLVLADAMSVLGDSEAAADNLTRAIDGGMNNPGLILRLIAIRQAQGDIDAARRRAISLAGVEPVSAQTRRERVAAMERLGLFEQARPDADILAQSDDPRDLLVSARIAGRLGDTQAVNDRLDRLLDSEAIPEAVLGPALQALAEAGRTRDAYALLERMRTDPPSTAFTLAEVALMLQTGRTEDAVGLLKDRYENNPNTTLAAARVRLLARLGRADEASAVCNAALASAPENSELQLLRDAISLVEAPSGANLASGQTDAARRVIDAIRQHAIESNDPDALIARLREVTNDSPTYFPAWSVLTTQLQKAGRIEEAAETAQTAMRLLPGDPRPARLAVDALLLQGEPRLALAVAVEWSRRSRPESYEADTTIAALQTRLGNYQNAVRALEPWTDRISSDPDATPILVRLLATLRIMQGLEDQAWAQLKQRIEHDERWKSHAIEVARDLLNREGSPESAAAWLDRVEATRSLDSEDTLRMAQARLDIASKTGSESDALAVIETLDRLEAMPDRPVSLERGAGLLRIAGERLLGREDAAARHAAELANAYPDDPIVLGMQALTIIEAGGDNQAALKAAKKAVTLAESGSDDRFTLTNALDALGRAQLALGHPDEAEKAFRRILGLQIGSVSGRLGLAEALHAAGKLREAKRIANDPTLIGEIEAVPTLRGRFEHLRAELDR